MFVYRLAEPIDAFDGLTPLHEWLAGQHPNRAAWALQAVLALADAASEVGWDGDMRHLPMVGGLPTLGATTPYLVVKQDNNGDTFVITTDTELPLRQGQPPVDRRPGTGRERRPGRTRVLT